MGEQLKPCPFCGGEATEWSVETYSLDSSYDMFGCRSCGIGFDTGKDAENVKLWNARPEATQVRVKPLAIAEQYAELTIETDFGDYVMRENPMFGKDTRLLSMPVEQKKYHIKLNGMFILHTNDANEFLRICQADFDRRIRAALEPDTVTDELSKSIADFASRQEPLGAEFEQVLADNIEELYETQPNTAADTVTGWQDISTAPHGVEVLLYCPDQGRPTNRERIELGMASFGKQGDGWSNVSHHSWATHWMPLPPAPEKEG